MSEKYSLKWNDFQSAVSQAFKQLQLESDFNDVILISEDDVQISAHKVVLSASSGFFKRTRKIPALIQLTTDNQARIYILGA